jgi:Flp pilus assembly protein CpaB
LFTSNGNKNEKGNPTSLKQDLQEFDQDLELYTENGVDNENRAAANNRNIPNFGVAKNPGKSSRIPARSDIDLTPATGQNPKKKLAAESKDTKKVAKPKKITTKQDNRWRFFFGLGLFVIGLAGSILLVQANTKGIEVIVATHDIAPGQKITNADLATARMSIPPDLATLLITSDEINTLITNSDNPNISLKVASRLLRGHQPIMRGDVVSPTTLNKTGVPEGMVAMALPVSASTAASRISSGDLVTLIYVNNKNGLTGNIGTNETVTTGQSSLETIILAEKVTVLDVARTGASINLGSTSNNGGDNGSDGPTSTSNRGTITNLTLLLTNQQAQKLAQAKENGTVNVVLLPLQIQLKDNGNIPLPNEKPSASPDTNPSPVVTSPPTLTNITNTPNR